MGQIPVAHADPQLFPARPDDSLISLRRIITEVLRRLSAACERTRDAPDDDAGLRIDIANDPAVRDGAAARHAQRSADQNVAFLHLHFSGQDRIVRDDGLPRARVLRKGLEDEVVFPSQRISAFPRDAAGILRLSWRRGIPAASAPRYSGARCEPSRCCWPLVRTSSAQQAFHSRSARNLHTSWPHRARSPGLAAFPGCRVCRLCHSY